MKLLSRCAGSTRAPAVAVVRASRTSASMRRSASGAHAIEVGQNAVTPNRGRRAARAAIAPPPSSVSMPSTPCTCTSMKPGTTRCRGNRGGSRRNRRTARPATTSAMRSPSITTVRGARTRSGRTTLAPDRKIVREGSRAAATRRRCATEPCVLPAAATARPGRETACDPPAASASAANVRRAPKKTMTPAPSSGGKRRSST